MEISFDSLVFIFIMIWVAWRFISTELSREKSASKPIKASIDWKDQRWIDAWVEVCEYLEDPIAISEKTEKPVKQILQKAHINELMDLCNYKDCSRFIPLEDCGPNHRLCVLSCNNLEYDQIKNYKTGEYRCTGLIDEKAHSERVYQVHLESLSKHVLKSP